MRSTSSPFGQPFPLSDMAEDDNAASTSTSPSPIAAKENATTAEQIRVNWGGDQSQQQRALRQNETEQSQRSGRPRYKAPFFPRAAQSEISE